MFFINTMFRKSNYDGKATHNGNQEQITILNPVRGRSLTVNIKKQKLKHLCLRYYIVLYGYENYSNVGFEAEYR